MVNLPGRGFSTLPEVVQGQPARAYDGRSIHEKQVAGAEQKELSEPHVHKEAIWVHNPHEQRDDHAAPRDQTLIPGGRPRKRLLWICAGISLSIVLAVGLGVGLTMGLRKHSYVGSEAPAGFPQS